MTHHQPGRLIGIKPGLEMIFGVLYRQVEIRLRDTWQREGFPGRIRVGPHKNADLSRSQEPLVIDH